MHKSTPSLPQATTASGRSGPVELDASLLEFVAGGLNPRSGGWSTSNPRSGGWSTSNPRSGGWGTSNPRSGGW
jgi:hypothetical protein